jgi:alkylated DNA repair dioxygenase AlkB
MNGWTWIVILIVVLTVFSLNFYKRTMVYKNYLKECPESDTDFCYIKQFSLELPREFVEPLLTISRQEGVRLEIPSKRQKAISIQKLQTRMPELVAWYESLCPTVSQVLGTEVLTTPLDQPNSLCLVVYEKEGDYIDWHFDTNHYNGRYFTMLVPVSKEPTCGSYEYKDADEQTVAVDLKQGDALIFEGDRVFHRGRELCKNQRRVILSCTFTTSREIHPMEAVNQTIKNVGIFGELDFSGKSK